MDAGGRVNDVLMVMIASVLVPRCAARITRREAFIRSLGKWMQWGGASCRAGRRKAGPHHVRGVSAFAFQGGERERTGRRANQTEA